MPNHHTVSKNMRVETVFRYVKSFLQRGKTGNAIFIICEKGRLMQSTFNIYIYIIFANFPLILYRLSQMRGSFFQNSIFYTLFFKKNMLREKMDRPPYRRQPISFNSTFFTSFRQPTITSFNLWIK